MLLRTLAVRILPVLVASVWISAGPGEASELVLGEMAPPIVAAKWIRGTPVEQYDTGRVYVVDLWSTWCAPCINAMPAIREIQTRYADGVTVIAMSVWEFDRQRIAKFMETHGGTMPAVVALDSVPDGKEPDEGLTAAKFLGTSGSASIPKLVIIDQTGRVAWIGRPDDIEKPLSQVVAGTWDLAAFIKSASSEEVVSEDKSGHN